MGLWGEAVSDQLWEQLHSETNYYKSSRLYNLFYFIIIFFFSYAHHSTQLRQISSSACIPKNWKCASKAGTSVNFTVESCTDAVGFKCFQNYVRINIKCAFFPVQISLVFYYLSVRTRASLFLSALVLWRKQGITKIDFASGSKVILIPGVSAGQFHPEAMGNHVVDKSECKWPDGLLICFAIWLCQESFWYNVQNDESKS